MRSDKEQYSSSEHDGAESDGEDDHPVGLAARRFGVFVGANALGGGKVDDAGLYPTLYVRFQFLIGWHGETLPKNRRGRKSILLRNACRTRSFPEREKRSRGSSFDCEIR